MAIGRIELPDCGLAPQEWHRTRGSEKVSRVLVYLT